MCPRCSSWAPINTVWDFWTCDQCHEAMDEWWVVDSVCWYSDEDDHLLPRVPSNIDYMASRYSPESLSEDDCICCDHDFMRTDCTCKRPPVDWTDFLRITRTAGISQATIYDIDSENTFDCYLCEYFHTFRCVPLRNWFRYYTETNTLPDEKISFCKYFSPDFNTIETPAIQSIFEMLENKEIILKKVDSV